MGAAEKLQVRCPGSGVEAIYGTGPDGKAKCLDCGRRVGVSRRSRHLRPHFPESLEGVRPPEKKARKAVEAFLREVGHPELVDFVHLVEDGEDAWAWWTNEEDTTSYVHHDLKIEWLGSSMPPEEEE